MASFYEQYVQPYVKSAAQSAAIDLATKQFIGRGMSQEEAYKAAFQLVTGETLPIIQTSWWDQTVLGIKMPYILAGGALFFIFGIWKSR